MIIIHIALIFILLVLLLRLKVPFTLTVLLLSVLLGIQFGLNFLQMLQIGGRTLIKQETLSLIAIVGLILVFSDLLNYSGHLKKISKLTMSVFGTHKLSFAILPALIGLLPMPGGALFSAPMVDGLDKEICIPPHKKTLINYWFRHIWEYTWPLYPGLILAAGIAKLPLYSFTSLLLPLFPVAILVGIIFTLSGITISQKMPISRSFATLFNLIYLIFPIALIIILFLAIHLTIWICVLISVAWVALMTLITKKMSIKQVFTCIFMNYKTYSMILMVASVLIFVGIMQSSTLTTELAAFFGSGNGNSLPIVYCLIAIIFFPLMVGLLTGLTIAFVGTSFPIIISAFIPSGYSIMPFVFLAYTAGLTGVMLSPTHLCLILTNQYFGSSLKKVYQFLIPTALSVLAAALVLFFIYLKFA